MKTITYIFTDELHAFSKYMHNVRNGTSRATAHERLQLLLTVEDNLQSFIRQNLSTGGNAK